MQGKTDDLRNAKASHQPDVDLTYSELLDELADEYGSNGDVSETDVTANRLAARLGVCRRYAQAILERKIDTGKMVRERKRDPATNRVVWVYRKA
ncbi:MAG: hypothetical protein C0391_03970 [Anaerolinea sp.]|nr:hypothetical protein [Anaerolinea sp.]